MKMKTLKIEELKAVVVTALWAAAIGMGIAGSVWAGYVLLFWAIMTGLVAACVTAYMIADFTSRRACREERLKMEHLADLAIAAAEDQAEKNVRHLS